jgi:hypothetical protein
MLCWIARTNYFNWKYVNCKKKLKYFEDEKLREGDRESSENLVTHFPSSIVSKGKKST